MEERKNWFLNLLAFVILMSGRQTLTKSPDYIVEKYERYLGNRPNNGQKEYPWGLDGTNQQTLYEYTELWKVQIDGIVNRYDPSQTANQGI